MPKRLLMKGLALCLSVCIVFATAGCAASDEFINLLNLTEPAAEGIVGIVCLADAAVCPIITAALATYKVALEAVTNTYHDWQTADASAQPGKLGALQAAVQTLQADFRQLLTAAHVVNPARQNAIDALGNAVAGEIIQIAQIVTATQNAGGTTSAAILVVLHEDWGGGKEPQTAPQTGEKKRKSLKPALSSKHFKGDLKKILEKKSGDAALDKVNAETAAKLK